MYITIETGKKAVAVTDEVTLSNNQQQGLSALFSVDCTNCILLKEKINYAPLELQSTRTIISILHDNNSKATASEDNKSMKQISSKESSVYESTDEKWISVCHGFNKRRRKLH